MTTTNRPDALDVLTRAADAAGSHMQQLTASRTYLQLARQSGKSLLRRHLAASGPDHWCTIAATLRTAVEWNRLVAAVELRTPEDHATTSTAIAALLPLAEQVLRDLPGTAS